MKSERLRKYEGELQDLEQWLKLGLVPKKDLEKHKEEMMGLISKIEEEKARLRFLKESGEFEELPSPKKQASRQPYQELQSLPDMEVGEEGLTDAGLDMETETFETETTFAEENEEFEEERSTISEEEEEDPFSDRNRWRRGVLEDPDSDNW